MANVIKLRKGLNIHLQGKAEERLIELKSNGQFALVPDDFEGVTPKVVVKEGDKVKAGDALFVNKQYPEVKFASPVSGTVREVVRGERRKVLCIKVEADKEQQFTDYGKKDVSKMDGQQVVDARVLVPVGRTNPHIGGVANLGKNFLQVGLAHVLDVWHIQLVGTQADKDVVRVILVDEFGQPRGLGPALGGTAVPDDLNQRVPVLVAIGCKTLCQTLQHRVTEEEDCLGSSVHGGTPC